MMRDVPRASPASRADTWTAIVGIPVPSGPAPTPLTDAQIPADAMHLVERLTGSLP